MLLNADRARGWSQKVLPDGWRLGAGGWSQKVLPDGWGLGAGGWGQKVLPDGWGLATGGWDQSGPFFFLFLAPASSLQPPALFRKVL